MFHQKIVDPELVADTINNIKGDLYQIIPFKRHDTDSFLILWKDYPCTKSECKVWGYIE